MEPLERLCQLGQVERVDQAVLDAALAELAETIYREASSGLARTSTVRRRHGRTAALAAVAVLAAAATFAAAAWLGHSAPTSRPVGAQSGSHGRPSTAPTSTGSSRPASAESRTMAAVLTAFSASGNDILMVTKVVRGEGTCCRTIIWTPARSTPGTTTRTRIKNFSLGGSRLSDMELSYTAPATTPPASSAGCDEVFLRPKIALAPAKGLPGTMTRVDYLDRLWVDGDVRVEQATVPGAAPLRACLKDGQWRDIGQAELGGAKVIELVSADGFVRLWVSAATFLPVRLVSTMPRPYGPATITFTFKFLQPTAANEAALRPPPIPAGFTRHTLPGG
jgi:hypothetical protein